MRRRYIIEVSLAACITLYLVEQFFAFDYVAKTAVKIVLFTAAPCIYYTLLKGSPSPVSLSLRKTKRPAIGPELLLGAVSFTSILCLYFLLGRFIDFGAIVAELGAKSKVDASNFPLIGAYIVFGNSFLEELFFRGFVFLGLYRQGFRRLAYLYSSVLFGAYHIAVLGTWISTLFLMLAVSGLALAGIIFAWLDSRSGSITNSWIVHIAADAAVVLVGMNMFNLI
jgi:membrane protease YdiL (CAAX protease family)